MHNDSLRLITPRKRALPLLISAALLSGSVCATADDTFPPVIDVSNLDGTDGFRMDGVRAGDSTGSTIASTGDVNGDGIDDVIIGAPGAGPRGTNYAGSSFVVFGRVTGFPSFIPLSTLDGQNGFRLDGETSYDYAGEAVSSAGDINGDGIDDLIIGASEADPSGVRNAGASYVVFGRNGDFKATVPLGSLSGHDGFLIYGAEFDGRAGSSVSHAGDVNGDGIDDVIVGAVDTEVNGNPGAGASYVIFGSREGFESPFDLSMLDGSNGFRMNGERATEAAGVARGAGDINGDGLDDVMIGAPRVTRNKTRLAGAVYVIFGRLGHFDTPIRLESLNGSNGFRIDGEAERDAAGRKLSALGDVNGDGIDDIGIVADEADPNGLDKAGSAYVLFGRNTPFTTPIALSHLDGSNGFRVDGTVSAPSTSGRMKISTAGDVNDDGLADLLIAAFNGNHVIFGRRSGFSTPFTLDSVTPAQGFRIEGSGLDTNTAGDVNADSIDDLIMGNFSDTPADVLRSGSAHVVFGRRKDPIFGDGFEQPPEA